MKIQKNSPDRRKDKRFKLKDPVFALMYFSPTMMGRVTDISRSGAAVRYVKSGDGYRELNQLDIFKSDFKSLSSALESWLNTFSFTIAPS